ncbi:TonB-dependent receptor [Adhaeribacter terreus]|uniref:Carboxypeptidase-like regulatory domain-containing protein n=1 Tax=Adhaeribacter terreus TaxID=529703 RepID=A0ABW0E6X9_9BACT
MKAMFQLRFLFALPYHFLLFLLLFLAFLPASGQTTFTLSGFVRDSQTNETLPGASIILKNDPQKGTVTDANGFYQLTFPSGNHTVLVQYIGYQPLEKAIHISTNTSLNFQLSAQTKTINEVEITGRRTNENVRSTQMGEVILPMEQIKTLPVLFGETDIIKTIQLLPGVKSGGEGNTGFYVRGGGSDQNLVLLNDAIVYNPGHLMNFFSVFNSDAIGKVTLLKGNMPARYGGRLSSVLDISTRNGNSDSLKATGGLGLIASRLTLEGPIVKNKASFLLSGRRTYIDQLAAPFLKNTDQGGVPYYFYDLNGGLSYEINQKNRLYLDGYYGRDVGEFSLQNASFKAQFDWGNTTASARWNHIFNPKLFLNVSGLYTVYQFNFNSTFDTYTSKLVTGVKDKSAKIDLDWQPNARHTLQFGSIYTHHTLTPRAGQAQTEDGLDFSTDRVKEKFAHEAGVYISEDWAITDRFQVSAGLRGSFFRQSGPFTLYNFETNGALADSTVYEKGEKVTDFNMLEPRFSFRYAFSERASVKAGFSQNAQYLHLVSNSFTSLPLDIWVPSSVLVPPQKATQFAAGYFRNFLENNYEASAEIYYKILKNQLEYRESYAPGPSNRDLEYEFVSGDGDAYGLELFVRKNFGALQGWIGYTLSYTNRKFPELNEGKAFPARFDRRHDGSVVISYTLNDRWKFGGSFVYATGQPLTIPVRRYVIEGIVTYQYGDRNGFRMESFHRLDLSATYEKPTTKKLKSSWTFAIYNVYARQNPFFYYIDSTGNPYDNSIKLQAKKVSIFPFPIPSVTWNFTF